MNNLLSFLETVRSFFVGTFSEISSNMSLDLGIKLVLGYFFIIWGAFIIWVIKDITNRTTNILIQALSIFIILFFTPIFGLPIYLLIRPRATLFEQYYEEEEEKELTDDLEEFYHCPGCNHAVSRDFKFCPKCAFELTVSCPSCKKQIHTDWALCPYCGEKNITLKKQKKDKKISLEKAIEKERKEDVDDKKSVLKEKES
ncbi:MAG: hypothetical protein ACD_78C00136G0003 [uncultured bacterium (gcode 4)]|uniref:DZANK-type domain-containing protein n=1 Tax=uncultured bacterium (gcode 4) TaxID=1234023 RepID=K1XYG9_9BACT|nr:MAG: hypothetical protein ACD_78C00136G0003 [uncultured bacterium (gcode 4)]